MKARGVDNGAVGAVEDDQIQLGRAMAENAFGDNLVDPAPAHEEATEADDAESVNPSESNSYAVENNSPYNFNASYTSAHDEFSPPSHRTKKSRLPCNVSNAGRYSPGDSSDLIEFSQSSTGRQSSLSQSSSNSTYSESSVVEPDSIPQTQSNRFPSLKALSRTTDYRQSLDQLKKEMNQFEVRLSNKRALLRT
jgi:hypothetical protein